MEISVRGTASLSVRPERATVHVQVEFESPTQEEAFRRTTDAMHAVSGLIAELMGRDPSPLHSSVVLPIGTRSWRPYGPDGQPGPPAFAATGTVRLTFSDFAAVAEVGARLGESPGVSIQYVEWSLSEETRTRLEAQVVADAVRRARERAETIAAAEGVERLDCLTLSDPGLSSPPETTPFARDMAYGAMAMAKAAGPGEVDVAPEEITVACTIEGRYRAT